MDSPRARSHSTARWPGRPGAVRFTLFEERLEAHQVGVVAEQAASVLQRHLADLPIGPRSVDRDRLLVRPERRHDRGHAGVVQGDTSDLGQHRLLPRLIAEAGLATPGSSRRRHDAMDDRAGHRCGEFDMSDQVQVRVESGLDEPVDVRVVVRLPSLIVTAQERRRDHEIR